MTKFECRRALCDDVPCGGHRVTKDIDQAARIIAWTDGWDVMEESDQADEYWQAAACALGEIARPFAGCEGS